MKENKRLLEIDAMRGFAAIIVVFFHLTMQSLKLTKAGFKYGMTGVDLFFIISGFVIFMTLEKTRNWKDFAISRFSRLYPAYWFSVSFVFLLVVSGHTFLKQISAGVSPGALYFANMTMLQHYFNINNLDGPYWTLIIELVFYVFMIVIFQAKKLQYIIPIGIAVMVLSLTNHFLKPVYPALSSTIAFIFPLINYFPLFFAGILFYKIKYDGPDFNKYLLIAITYIIQGILFYGERGNTISQKGYFICISLHYLIFILYVNGRLSFLVNKPMLFLGSISYSLYLCHQYLSLRVIIPWARQALGMPYVAAAAFVALPAVIILAWLVTTFIEKPAMAFIRKRYKREN